MDIDGTSAVVTGGASGLGEATVRALAGRGARVVVVDLQDDKGEALAAEVGGLYARADVTDATAVVAALDAAGELGPLRSCVNCAGIGWATRTIGRDGTYESAHDLDVYRKVIEVNLVGTFNVCRLAASAMSRTEPLADGERGAIVNVASLAAFDGQIGQAAYAASKGGVAALTLPVARELARSGIRVVAIAPGIFATPMMAAFPQEVQDALAKSVPFPPRLGHPSEFAALVRHIVQNAMLNGETIRLDGALRMAPR